MSHVRKCILDGTKYEYCPNCSGYNSNEKWRLIYCSDNCRQIDHIRDAYKSKKISVEEAKKQLSNYDVPSIENILDWAKPIIEEILKDTTSTVIEELEVSTEETPEPTFTRKRGKKNKKLFNEEIVNENLETEKIIENDQRIDD